LFGQTQARHRSLEFRKFLAVPIGRDASLDSLPGKIQPHKYLIGDTYADSALNTAIASQVSYHSENSTVCRLKARESQDVGD